MVYETVLYDVADRICTITLNRPEKLNAWTHQMHLDLKDAIQEAGSDSDVRAIILTGAGRGFCAGADMGGLQAIGAGGSVDRSSKAATNLPGGSTLAEFRMNYSYFPAAPKFIIAAINGPAAGLGFVIPLYADLRFAAESAVFTTAFAQRGLIAEHGVSWLLPKDCRPAGSNGSPVLGPQVPCARSVGARIGEPGHPRRQADGRNPRLCPPAGRHRLAALGGCHKAPDLGGRVPDPG